MNNKMKKVCAIFVAFVLVSVGVLLYAGNRDKKISVDEIPPKAKQFISTHFGKDGSIVHAEKKWYSYEVYLANGFEIDFYTDGEWKEIEAHRQEIPSTVINTLPKKISDYITEKFKGWTMTELKKKKYGYEIELVNPAAGSDVEIKFNHQGDMLKVDY